jgi:hypothetical protein
MGDGETAGEDDDAGEGGDEQDNLFPLDPDDEGVDEDPGS